MPTEILWTDETWNPIVGCSKVSPGCLNCYAERMAWRLACMEYEKLPNVEQNYTTVMTSKKWNGNTVFVESALEKPLHWRKPRNIFVCSMSDLFHESVPFEWITRVFKVMEKCPQHTFQVLTKRPERMKEFIGPSMDHLPNLWLGVTAENQEQADIRIPILLQIPAALRFVSVEPMLGAVDLNETSAGQVIGVCDECGEYHGNCDCCMGIPSLDWVIIGAESGPKRRWCKTEWVQGLVNQCKDANVPAFVKQIHKLEYQKGSMTIKSELVKAPAGWPREMPKGVTK